MRVRAGQVLIATSCWLFFVGVQPLQVAAAVFAFWVVGGVGERIVTSAGLISLTGSGDSMWRLGPGVVLGIFVLYTVRVFTTKEVFVGVFLVFAVWDFLSRFSFRFAMVRQSELRHHLREKPGTYFRSTSLVFLVMGVSLVKNWPWLSFLFAWTLLVYVVSFQQLKSLRSRLAVSAGAIAAGFLTYQWALRYRADLWWFLADDYQLFEARARSLVEFGPRIDAVASARDGIQALTYHHGAFLLSGIVDTFTLADQYRTLAVVTPVLMVAVVVASVIVLQQTLSKWFGALAARLSLVGAGCFLALLPIRPGMLSDFFGAAAIISSTAVACRASSVPDTFRSALICALAVLATALSKAPFLYASAIVIVVILMSTHGIRAKSLILTAATSVSVLGLLRIASPVGGDLRLSPFNSYSLFELAEGSSLLKALAFIAVLAPVSIGLIVCAWTAIYLRYRVVTGYSLGMMMTILVGYGSRFLFGGRIETLRYMWQPALIATALVISLALTLCFRLEKSSSRHLQHIILGVLISVVFLLATQRLVPNLNSGSVFAKLLRVIRNPDFLQLVAASLFGLFLATRRPLRPLRGGSGAVSGLSAVSILASIAVSVSLYSQSNVHLQELRDGRNGETDAERSDWVGSPSLLEASRYLREETEKSSLVAITLCKYLSEGCPTEDFRFAAYSERRFLSLGGSWVLFYSSEDAATLDALGSTVDGPVELSDLTEFWRSRGVNYGVIDRGLIPDPSVVDSDIAVTEAFRNSDYLIVKLSPYES